MFRKIKYIALFIEPIENSFELIGKKRIDISKKQTVFNKIPYLLDDLPNQKPIAKGLKKFYFIQINKGFISFEKIKSQIDMEIVGTFISKNIVSNLFSNLMNRKFGKRDLTDIILGGVIGLAIGFIIGSMMI